MTYQANDLPLRRVLQANAAFSAICGLVLALAPATIAAAVLATDPAPLGLAMETIFLAIGLGLIVFAGFVALAARQPHVSRRQIKLIAIADLLWVADSAAVLAFMPEIFTAAGLILVAGIGSLVLVFAVGQLTGLARLYQGRSNIRTEPTGAGLTISAKVETRADPARVWQVMSDLARYAEVADSLSRVEVVSGRGVGLVRRCTDTKGQSWQETCTRWDEGRGYAFLVDTSAPDFPYPFANLSGSWSLRPHDNGTEIAMTFEIQGKPGLLNTLMLSLMVGQGSRACDRVLEQWVRIMEGEAQDKADLAPSSDQVSLARGA